jgi:hypothetical protein
MDTCILCGKDFVRSSEKVRELCQGCNLVLDIDIREKSRAMRRCEHLVDTSGNHRARLHQCLILVQKAKWLQRYENLGIQTIVPPPSQWISRFNAKYDDIIMERILEEVDEVMALSEREALPGALDGQINRILQKIEEGKRLFLDKTKSESLNARIKNYVYNNLLTLTV